MSIIERDKAILWHPYTRLKDPLPLLPIASANGAELALQDGHLIVDAISSWWSVLHGHCEPRIVSAVSRQCAKLDHVLFAGCTHAPGVELAEQLLKATSPRFERVFYSDNGSTAVEVALKLAIQAHNLSNKSPAKRIFCFENSYHGDTFGAMSVSGRGLFTEHFASYLFDVTPIALPTGSNISSLLEQIENELSSHSDTVAFIFEPLVQGAAGMKMYDSRLLDKILSVFQRHGVLLIADEVMTGFGRTGTLFAIEQLSTPVDLLCLSKGLSGGILPLAATLVAPEVVELFDSDEASRTFFHGHTFTANPIACAAGLESFRMLLEDECNQRRTRIHQHFSQTAAQLHEMYPSFNVRQIGTILAFDIQLDNEHSHYLHSLRNDLYMYFLESEVLLRPLGNTVYALPPYCINDSQLRKVTDAMFGALEAFVGSATKSH